ncbi:MAG: hypothetical protein IJ651_05155 [Bacteroidales bacterium]|nr:hypothetical protein [Bacteroidales bacterium]
MKRENLHQISNLEELEVARRAVSRDLNQSRKAIGQDVTRLRDGVQPMNLVGNGLHLIAPAGRPLDTVLLSWIRRAKNWLLHL